MHHFAFFWVETTFPGDPPFVETHGNSGTLDRSAYAFKERNNINSLQKKNIYQKFGGHGPRAPPPLATPLILCDMLLCMQLVFVISIHSTQ